MTTYRKEVLTFKTLLIAALLGLSACQKSSEDRSRFQEPESSSTGKALFAKQSSTSVNPQNLQGLWESESNSIEGSSTTNKVRVLIASDKVTVAAVCGFVKDGVTFDTIYSSVTVPISISTEEKTFTTQINSENTVRHEDRSCSAVITAKSAKYTIDSTTQKLCFYADDLSKCSWLTKISD